MENIELTKMRYQKVYEGLRDDYLVKGLFSGVLWIWTLLQNIFATNSELIVLLLVAVTADWITGHIRARKDGLEIVSLGWRQTIVKVLEYALFLFVLTGISNVFGRSGYENWIGEIFTALKNIDVFGYFYLTLTELKSIVENLSGNQSRFAKLVEWIENKIGIDDIE